LREWLKEMRVSKMLTQVQVADLVGIVPHYYSYIESGARRPSVETAKKIATALGFEWTLFFEDEEPPGVVTASKLKSEVM